MNKTKKKCIFTLLGLFVLMMTAASVNADEDPNLIAPNPETDQEPNLIAPNPETDQEPNLIAPSSNKDAVSGDNAFTKGLILVIGISGVAGLAAALIIFKKKN